MKKPRTARPRRLQYETLERREVMAAGVTAALSGGVLNIFGSDADDVINLRQTSTKIYVAGVNGSWAASKVKAINVNPNGGNDTVSLNSFANGGNTPLVENVTVRAGFGNEKVRLANGQEVNFNGAGNALFVSSTGFASMNGTPLNFTSSLQTSFANGVLTITGTNGNDSIKLLKAWNGYLAIQGVNGAWPASGVSAVVINLQEGNDQVCVDSLANGGSFALGVAVTVNSGTGNKRVTVPSGNYVDFTGYGHQLKVAADGAATYDGAPIVSVPSTVQTSWVGGVLTITGTNGNNTLNIVKAWNGYFAIQGVSGAWPSAGTNSIVVNMHDGNDIVSLDSLANGGSFELGVAVTVNSGPGNKRVILPDGHNVDFTGYGHQLKVAANGSATYDGWALTFPDPDPPPPPSNWFDANIQDAALRALGSSLYTDGLINRSDIIALLNNTKDGDTIDGAEITDLRRIADNASLFGSSAYLRTLTSYVAYGTVANSNYQGEGFGGLGGGAVASQMDKMVNKWFLGLDRPLAGGTYQQIAGQLFVLNAGGAYAAAYTDVKQGSVGDCYYLCALAEIAHRSNSTITSMFIVNGDGTYGVKFHRPGGQTFYVTVDSYLPTNSSGNSIYARWDTPTTNELWVALAEKAYAQLNEFGWSRADSLDIDDEDPVSVSGHNTYAALDSGYIFDALKHVTGLNATFAFTSHSNPDIVDPTYNFNSFVTAYNAGKLIGFASYSFSTTVNASGVVGGHAYAVVGYNATTQQVTLFNPWGTQQTQAPAFLTMSWPQIQANFEYFDRTV